MTRFRVSSSRLRAAFLLAAFTSFCTGCFAQVTVGSGVTIGTGVYIGPAPSNAPVFSPTGGTYSGAQTVTISCPIGGEQATYTTDGSAPNIASPLYSAPITVSSTQTINAICSDTPVYMAETQESSTGYKCVTQNAETYGSLTCEAGGGVTGQPTNVSLSFGSTMNYSQTSTGVAQSLIPFSGTACNSCDHMAQDMWVEAQGTSIMNNEMDMFDFNTTDETNHQIGLQSNEQASFMQWQIDSNGGTGWVNTGVKTAVPIPTGSYTHVSLTAHWTNGDTTGPHGHGYTYYDDLCVNGTCASLASLGGQPNPALNPTWSAHIGNQSQLDETAAGGTIGRNIQHNTVAAAIGPPSAVTSATYTIQ